MLARICQRAQQEVSFSNSLHKLNSTRSSASDLCHHRVVCPITRHIIYFHQEVNVTERERDLISILICIVSLVEMS